MNSIRCAVLMGLLTLSAASQYMPVERLQQLNAKLLANKLASGWRQFCDAGVDEGVMSLYPGINPSDAIIHVMTLTNQSIDLPIRKLSEIGDFDIQPHRKTLLYVNGYHTPDSYFSVQSHLKLLQQTRRDLNVIVLDFAQNLPQLYYAVRHHVTVQGYFVAKMLATLTLGKGTAEADITLAGHSVGANIAALGATLYAGEHPDRPKIGSLIAIDPALMCQPSDVYVTPSVCARVVVLHGEGDLFGVREPCGTIDIYPNGIGYFPRRKMQPGCATPLCSHLYSFVLFMDALIEGVMIPAVRCDDWAQFRKHACDYNNIVAIGLNYPASAEGVYFCVTQANPPFTFMEHGLKYKTALKVKPLARAQTEKQTAVAVARKWRTKKQR